MKIRKKHANSFKLKVALEAAKGNKTLAEMCQEFGVVSSQIYSWKKQLEDHGGEIFADKRHVDHKNEIDRLHRVIGKITVERDFLSRALDH